MVMSVDSKMTAIANDIRGLTGSSDVLGLVAMDAHLDTVQAEVNAQGDLLDLALTLAESKAASGGSGGGDSSAPVLQSKSVTPTEAVQTVTPDSGYDGLLSVSIGAINKNYVGTGVTRKSAQTYTPGKSDQTIASGLYLDGTQTIKGDTDLVAENIKKGVSIFNVIGSYEGPGGIIPSGTLDITDNGTHDVTNYAEANVNVPPYLEEPPEIDVSTGGLITATAGGLTAQKQLPTQEGKNITPAYYSQTAVYSGKYTTGKVTVAGDENLIAENIKSGVSIFDVMGSFVGESGDGGGLPSGVSALASGTYTPTADSTASVNIEHGLGVAPNFAAFIIEDGSFADTPIKLALVGGLAFAKPMKKESGDTTVYHYHYYLRTYTNTGAAGYSCSQSTTNYLTTTTLRLHASSAAKLLGGYTYRWVCGVLDGIE